MWLLFDIMSVFFHMSTILVLATVPLFLTAFSEIEYSSYSVADVTKLITQYDITLTPWTLIDKLLIFRQWNVGLILLDAVFILLQLVELFSYYGAL